MFSPELGLVFVWILLVLPVISQFLPPKRNESAMLRIALLVNECVNRCLHGALHWTSIPSRVYSHLIPTVPWIDSRTTATLTQEKNEWMNEWFNQSINDWLVEWSRCLVIINMNNASELTGGKHSQINMKLKGKWAAQMEHNKLMVSSQ